MIGLDRAVVSFGTRRVLDGLSFTAQKGETLAILGPNGRGKTTALRALLNLQKLQSGRRFGPQVVGYVPQTVPVRNALSGLSMVVMGRTAGLGLFGQPGRADRDAAMSALEEVGVPHLASARFDRMSGGERQMVMMARALATGSSVLVLDEPAAALDLANQQRLLSLLTRLMAQGERTLVFTTHEPNHALAVADRVVLMQPGTPVSGSASEMLTAASLRALYGVDIQMVTVEGNDGQRRHVVIPAFAGGIVDR